MSVVVLAGCVRARQTTLGFYVLPALRQPHRGCIRIMNAAIRRPQFISLFSGIGGFDLGFERAGWTCVAQVEIDAWCQRILTKHWPDVPKFIDIRDVRRHNLPQADAIIGGFPCQPHSVAGQQKGATDNRNLWPEYLRIVTELRPLWVVGENVPGLRTTMLDQVLSDLDSADYTAITLNLPAVAFDAPHRRERLFIVAHANGHDGRSNSARQNARTDGRNIIGWVRPAVSNSKSTRLATGQQAGKQTSEKTAHWRMAQPRPERCGGSWWTTEPDVGRMAHGVAHRMDRIRGLGNAVVPQVAEWIAKIILQTFEEEA